MWEFFSAVPFVCHEGDVFCTSFLTKRFWRLRKKLEEGNKSGDTEKLSVLDNKGRMIPLR